MAASQDKRRAHGGPRRGSVRRAGLAPALAALLVVVGLVAGGCELLGSHHAADPAGGGGGGGGGGAAVTTTVPPTTTAQPTLKLLYSTPHSGNGAVVYDPVITVHFSAQLATDTALPTMTPAEPGSWQRSGSELIFHPAGNIAPYTAVTITFPGGLAGVRSTEDSFLGASEKVHFTIRGGSELRLQQLLAELGYLPVKFVPGSDGATQANTAGDAVTSQTSTTSSTSSSTTSSPTTSSTSTVPTTTAPKPTTTTSTTTTSLPGSPPPDTTLIGDPAAGATSIDEPDVASDIPLTPLPGHFVWRYGNIPPSLSALWSPGNATVITTGAVMAFEANHGLTWDGVAGPAVWQALLQAVAHRQAISTPYDYVYVSTYSPEYIDLWSDGKVIFQSLANTGISAAPTEAGTWPVYARYLVTTMSGTNPDGSHYDDTGIKWVSYFHGGDALHYFPRPGYGYPQSLGCVELPYRSAQVVYGDDPIGTLVSIG